MRGLPHLGKGLLRIPFDDRLVGKDDAADDSRLDLEFELIRNGLGNGDDNRSERIEAYVGRAVAPVDEELLDEDLLAVNLGIKGSRARNDLLDRFDKDRTDGRFPVSLEGESTVSGLGGCEFHGSSPERECQHLDRLCILADQRQSAAELCRTGQSVLCIAKISHCLFRLDPRAAALAPARAVEHTDFDSEFSCGLEHCVKDIPPLVSEQSDRTLRNTLLLADHADKSPVDADFLHCLKVFHHAVLRHVAGHPVPVDTELLVLRSVSEVLLNSADTVLGPGLATQKQQDGCKPSEIFAHMN